MQSYHNVTEEVVGQVEIAEVRKPKYGSEKKSRLSPVSVSSALLTHDCTL